ncbi:ABC transporter permease, partial [Christensenellaceae bacterium OttesenSCG-928-K19]|nr:ABC transporter permease [Christensenellaceae bacterium OttesenSCG-928-K19]
EEIRGIFLLNPMSNVIVAYRDILFYKQMPEMGTLLSTVVIAAVSLVLGFLIFNKLQKRFAEEM